ncbi:MAG TPA: PAS domain-containing protein [Stellaceae bacterium]|nr:PAS domain-containing protein [Stellaceae bacterium]
MGFVLLSDRRLDPALDPTPPALKVLYTYWLEKRRGQSMPSRRDIDTAEILANLGRVHLLEVEGPTTFRYRLYGSHVTNPDGTDMTGLTTRDYRDVDFGSLVTRHHAECVRERSPVCYEIRAKIGGDPYDYARLALPLSEDGERVDMILVGSVGGRIRSRARRGAGGSQGA